MSSLILCNNNKKPFLNQIVMCDGKWILYISQWPAQWLDREDPKHFPKLNLHPKKGHVTVWWSAAPLTHYSFLNPGETITSEKDAQQNWWDALKTIMPTTSTSQQKRPSSPWQHPTARYTTNASQVEGIGLQSFSSSAIITWPLTNWLPLLQASWQLFTGKTLPQPAGGRKCFPRVCQTQRHRFSHYGNKPTYFSLAKCVDFNGCYFD